MAKISFLLKKYKSDIGIIYIKYCNGNQRNFISTNIKINLTDWSEEKQTIINKAPKLSKERETLELYRAKLSNYKNDCLINSTPYNFTDITEIVNSKENSENFNEFVTEMILKKAKDKGLAPESMRQQKSQLTKLMKFKDPIPFSELNEKLIYEYKAYMTKIGNNTVTIGKCLCYIRGFCLAALKQGLIKANPFESIKIDRGKGNRTFLEKQQLTTLENLYSSNKFTGQLQNTLKVFLFACYTGLRYTDLKNLKHSQIENNFIELIQHKTNEKVRIFLIDKAKNLIGNDLKEGNALRVYANQVMNRNIKEIMKAAEINKRISMHCARHTFATISLNLGIPIEVVSKSLGHTKIGITEIYAKVLDKYKEEQMVKWNSL